MAQHRMCRGEYINNMALGRHRNSPSTGKPSYVEPIERHGDKKYAPSSRVAVDKGSSGLTLKEPASFGLAGNNENVDGGNEIRVNNERFGEAYFDGHNSMVDVKCENFSHGSGCSSVLAIDGPPRKRLRMRIVPHADTQNVDACAETNTSGLTDKKKIDMEINRYTKTRETKSEQICVNILKIPKPSFGSCRDLDRDKTGASSDNANDGNSETGFGSKSKYSSDGLSESDLEQLTYYPSKPSNYDPIYGYDSPPAKIEDENVREHLFTLP